MSLTSTKDNFLVLVSGVFSPGKFENLADAVAQFGAC